MAFHQIQSINNGQLRTIYMIQPEHELADKNVAILFEMTHT